MRRTGKIWGTRLRWHGGGPWHRGPSFYTQREAERYVTHQIEHAPFPGLKSVEVFHTITNRIAFSRHNPR